MDIRIEKKILLETLGLIVNISPKASSEQIINKVLIEAFEDGTLTFKVTNYDHSISGSFKTEVLKPGMVCVNTSKLFNLTREFTGNEISIQATPQNWVFIHCGRSKIKLPGVEPSLFPKVEFNSMENLFQLDDETFKKAIERTYFTIGENESRKNLMGLNLKIKAGDEIQWMGADAFRISRLTTKLEKSIQAKGDIIIPKKSLLEVKRILDYTSKEGVISFDANTFQVFSGSLRFKTRLIEADYPNLDSIIESKGEIKASLPTSELIHSLRILYRVVDEDPTAVMKLTLKKGEVLLESQKLEFGEGNDVIFCDYEGEEISIGINIKFFMEAVGVFEQGSSEMIDLNLSAPLAPIMLTNRDWENYRTILMPVKIKW